jgi:hypothetical protein
VWSFLLCLNFHALRFTTTGPPPTAERTRILPVTQHAITFGMKGSSYLCSQITGVENAVPSHVDIPCTGGRGFDLPSEDSLQEYLKFL